HHVLQTLSLHAALPIRTVIRVLESDGAGEGAQLRFRILYRLGVRRRRLAITRGFGSGPLIDDVAVLVETDPFQLANWCGSVGCRSEEHTSELQSRLDSV